MTQLHTWARLHNIAPAALADLRHILTGAPDVPPAPLGNSEAAVQAAVRVAASQRGWRLWRNNIGANRMENGSFVRWGLANDSQDMNRALKSADLIGIRPVFITSEHIGTTIGQFVSLECKHAKWHYAGGEREQAQRRWVEIITAMGGCAAFTTGGLPL